MFVEAVTEAGMTRAFTDRHGGVSRGPFAEFNLGDHVGDDPAAVAANRRLLAAALAVDVDDLAFMRQVHGSEVAEVPAAGTAAAGLPAADALVCAIPGRALVVLVADCVPVLLWDAAAGVIAAAHAGRPGLRAGILPATVAAMRDLGATTVHAALGPAVCGGCYEVPQPMQHDVAAVIPRSRATTRRGTPGLDLPAGALAQLADLGVRARSVAGCTLESGALFSYRRDGRTGRSAGVIVRRGS